MIRLSVMVSIISIVVLIDLMMIFILAAMNYPLTVSVMGYSISEKYVVILLMILYQSAILEWFFIAWAVRREKMWRSGH